TVRKMRPWNAYKRPAGSRKEAVAGKGWLTSDMEDSLRHELVSIPFLKEEASRRMQEIPDTLTRRDLARLAALALPRALAARSGGLLTLSNGAITATWKIAAGRLRAAELRGTPCRRTFSKWRWRAAVCCAAANWRWRVLRN